MKIQAYSFFWTATILIVFLGTLLFVAKDNSTIDINIGDTYYVIAYVTLAIFFAPLYFIQGLCYRLLLKYNKRPSPSLTQSHTLLSIGAFIGFLLLLLIVNIMHNPDNHLGSTDLVKTKTIGMLTILFALLLAQPIFLMNMAVGLRRK
ncbi:hypothetical protein [Flavobacterium cerinum]|uniref:Uncharacterized protein n=1 Tax=Flavobacterium cerinum TaxID=2502784 RepID=A0A444HDS4_9FLAO|nr:hypothetical protein [Flavobacterium cerinum]RWX02429.1 hypothetical protein EPI11_04205 [Flavobacterium cerinum]